MMPSVEEIEEYIQSVEETLFTSLSTVTPDLPNFREAVHRLWVDISRYGPPGLSSQFPDIHVPGLGEFEVPPPPPTPPPKSWLDKTTDWIWENPWTTSGIAAGVVGAGLLAGYGAIQVKQARIRKLKASSTERRQVVVILGGDTPLALPLILDFEKKGYIVIASVCTPEAVDSLERRCHGYVRALVLDPTEPSTIPIFLRSLTATLSRKFPLNAPGDPHASLSSYPYINSVISLLTLPSPAPGLHGHAAPLEHLSLRTTYVPHLLASHVTPLQIIQALMPLLRTTPARARDSVSSRNDKKTIIVCLPATDVRVGLPFASIQAMTAAATLRGVEILRREINIATLTDKTESMKHIKVVVAEVGAVNTGAIVPGSRPHDVYKAMEDWTPSEKLTYGPAFVSIANPPTRSQSILGSIFKSPSLEYGVPRTPTDVSVFVNHIVGVVSGGRQGTHFMFGLGIPIGRIRDWIRGERFSVGAGANTYRLASHLPNLILDTLLNIPHFLVSIRNALLPVPYARPLPPTPPPVSAAPVSPVAPPPAGTISDTTNHDKDLETSETGSEADVESNSGDGSGVDGSWVSLKARKQREDGAA